MLAKELYPEHRAQLTFGANYLSDCERGYIGFRSLRKSVYCCQVPHKVHIRVAKSSEGLSNSYTVAKIEYSAGLYIQILRLSSEHSLDLF